MDVEILNYMLDHSLSKSCDQLEKGGFFHPFSFVLNHDDDLLCSDQLTEEEKNADPEQFLQQIHDTLALGCKQKMHKAVAVVSCVKVERFKSEGFVRAVEVCIEMEDGSGFNCFLPYKIVDETYHYGTLFHSAFDSTKFASSSAKKNCHKS